MTDFSTILKGGVGSGPHAKGWEVHAEKVGVKRVSKKIVHGKELHKIEVWNTGKTGKTFLGSEAVGSWKVRGYKVGDKFHHSYKDAVAHCKEA